MFTIHVPSARAYDVFVDSDLLRDCGERIKKGCGGSCAVIVSDDNVFPLYGATVEESLTSAGYRVLSYVFRAGESSKTLDAFCRLSAFLCENYLSRNDVIIALGGGVVGDLAGFAAATYRRGIQLVQMPTTLLSAVDSSIGGKTGVNLNDGKNQIGSFYNPNLVLCDISALSTLPDREYLCGYAEVIKYGMISDADFFEELSVTPIKNQLLHVIGHCVTAKRDLVVNDERDMGMRMLLNFGHTFGHAVERCSHFEIPHGLAVAAGMSAITRAAAEFGRCDHTVAERLNRLLVKYRLPAEIPFSPEEIEQSLAFDKKREGSSLNIVVPRAIGKCEIERISGSEIHGWLTAGGLK